VFSVIELEEEGAFVFSVIRQPVSADEATKQEKASSVFKKSCALHFDRPHTVIYEINGGNRTLYKGTANFTAW
jgi:hypothetical protein